MSASRRRKIPRPDVLEKARWNEVLRQLKSHLQKMAGKRSELTPAQWNAAVCSDLEDLKAKGWIDGQEGHIA
jgi:hypothetical protein